MPEAWVGVCNFQNQIDTKIPIFPGTLISLTTLAGFLTLCFDFAEQRQHHYQCDELCNKCVRRLCHLLHPGLHGSAPGRRRVRGG